MSRRLTLTASQVTAICKGAARAGFIAEVTIGDVTVRLVPEAAVPATSTSQPDSDRWEFTPWPGPNLNYREEWVLRTLVKAKGDAVFADTIHYAGPKTVNSLLGHKLVSISAGVRDFDRHQAIQATAAGLTFFDRRTAHYGKHPHL